MQTYHFRPDKRLGQNFLTDPKAIDALVSAANISPSETVLEIGGGSGFITRVLLEHAKKVICFEPDESLVELLKAEHETPKLDLRFESAFEKEWPAFDKIVSAPPYHFSSLIMERLFFHSCLGGSLLFQREFVEKLTSIPGFRDYTSMTVLSQVRFNLTSGKAIPRGAFYPVPQSDSMVLALSDSFPHGKPVSLSHFFFMITELFRYKNKNLAKSLSLCQKPFEKEFGKKVSALISDIPTELMDKKVFQLEPTDFLLIEKCFSR